MNKLLIIIGFFFYAPFRAARRFEQYRINKLNQKSAVIDPTAKITETAVFRNYRRERSKIIIGYKTILAAELQLFRHGGEIIIGDHCFIGPGTRIWSSKKITIGHRVLISHNVNIHDQSSHPLDSTERHEDFKKIFEDGLQPDMKINEKEVVIKDDAWIGFNATILKGVTIGKGAIVGAGTTVISDVPDYAVVVGTPAKIIRYTT